MKLQINVRSFTSAGNSSHHGQMSAADIISDINSVVMFPPARCSAWTLKR